MAHPAGNAAPNEARGKQKACEEFFKLADLTESRSEFDPKEISPYALYNVNDTDKNTLIRAITSVNHQSLLVIVLGESNVRAHTLMRIELIDKILHPDMNLFSDPLITSFDGPITLLVIDPALDLPPGEQIQSIPVEERLRERRVTSLVLVDAKFPLTPIYGPHRNIDYSLNKSIRTANQSNSERRKAFVHLGQPNFFKVRVKSNYPSAMNLAERRIIHSNALDVLGQLIAFPNPIVISSRITSICYRSFKYLIDMRNRYGRQTTAYYGYTNRGAPEKCEDTFALFPQPFTKCSYTKNENIDKYYYLDSYPAKLRTPVKREEIRKQIIPMNQWANAELNRYIHDENRKEANRTRRGGKRTRQKTRKH